jgi:uncharacterized peroxidase-related enzyme
MERYGPLLELTQGVMRGASTLPPKHRELLAAFVSGLNECAFCFGAHEATAARFGVQPGVLAALLSDIESAEIDTSLRSIFTFAKKLTLEPSKITEQDREAFVAVHDADTLKDVIAIVALFNLFNRLLDGHGIQGSSVLFERDSEMLHSYGWYCQVVFGLCSG